MYAVGYLNPGMLAEQVQIFIIGFTKGAWHKTPQTIPDCAAPGQPNFPKSDFIGPSSPEAWCSCRATNGSDIYNFTGLRIYVQSQPCSVGLKIQYRQGYLFFKKKALYLYIHTVPTDNFAIGNMALSLYIPIPLLSSMVVFVATCIWALE